MSRQDSVEVPLPVVGPSGGLQLVATGVHEAVFTWEWRLSIKGQLITDEYIRGGLGPLRKSGLLRDAEWDWSEHGPAKEQMLRKRFEHERTDRVRGQVMAPLPASGSVVYCILAADVGRVKIGVSTSPVKRLSDLQGASPVSLTLYAWQRGGHKEESLLHQRFAVHRTHREWFTAHDSILGHFDRNGEWL